MKGKFKNFEKHDCQNVTKNGSMEPLNSVKNDLQIVSICIFQVKHQSLVAFAWN